MTKNNKVALITGGSRGIGKACAIELAQEGFDVAISFRTNEAAAFEVKKEVENLGRRIELYQSDIGSPEQTVKLVKDVLNDFHSIDVLVHNAGIGQRLSFEEVTPDIWNKHIDINLNSTYYLLKDILPIMKEKQKGNIVLVGSLSSKIGGVVNAAYAASKGALNSLAKYLVQDYGAYGVNINVIAPGLVETDLYKELDSEKELSGVRDTIPMKRLAKTNEIANVVKFLSTDASSYINGETIYISGGR